MRVSSDDPRPIIVARRWELGRRMTGDSTADHVCADCSCVIVLEARSRLLLAAGDAQAAVCVECMMSRLG